MATKVYTTDNVHLFDGTELEISPLKIKYLREFMVAFDDIKNAKNDDEAIGTLVECVRVCMKQYYPDISKTVEDVEDNVDMPTIYKILDISAGIKINKKLEEPVKKSEVFLLGIWKDYDELERSLSMSELMITLEAVRDLDYSEKKFLAAMQGVDLDAESGKDRGQKEWEDMKARVFSGGQTGDSNDVLSLQGVNAQKAGFGIGMGLDYENLT